VYYAATGARIVRGFGALLVFLAACGGGGKQVCPLPQDAASPAWADANADGVVDVVDGVRIARASLSGGPAPACRGQGDLMGSGDVAMEAAYHVWNHLFLGVATGMPQLEGCELRQDDPAAPVCSTAAVAVEGADRTDAPAGTQATFEATVELRADAIAPDAWSFGVRAEGCTIASVTRAGTVADSEFAGGAVDLGFAHATTVEGGAVSAVVPSWKKAVTVDASGDGAAVLVLSVQASAPSSGCEPCVLTPVGDLAAGGQPVALTIGSAGWSYPAEPIALEAKICAQ
jgi:hypothetical protein